MVTQGQNRAPLINQFDIAIRFNLPGAERIQRMVTANGVAVIELETHVVTLTQHHLARHSQAIPVFAFVTVLATDIILVGQLTTHAGKADIAPVAGQVVAQHHIGYPVIVVGVFRTAVEGGRRVFQGQHDWATGVADLRLPLEHGAGSADKIQGFRERAHIEEGRPGLSEQPFVPAQVGVTNPRGIAIGNTFIAQAIGLKIDFYVALHIPHRGMRHAL